MVTVCSTRDSKTHTYELVYRKCEWQRKRGRPWGGRPNFGQILKEEGRM